MGRNKYELQRGVLARKYTTILQGFEEAKDDRRIAWNCYQQIIAACEAMRDSGMDNNFICCAVNKSIREQEEQHQEWGLVMVVPQAVDDSMADMGKKSSFGKEHTGGWRDAYRALGYQAGKDFDPNSRLSGGQRRKVLGVGV